MFSPKIMPDEPSDNARHEQTDTEHVQADAPNAFKRLWDLGYRHLVPIVPPTATVSKHSHLVGRPKSLGKAPGERKPDGEWRGYSGWQTKVPTEAELEKWRGWGAGCGLRLGMQHDGTYLYAVDADTMHGPSAEIIQAATEKRFGLVPLRIGRAPKALYLVRARDLLPYRHLAFEHGVVEVLGEIKQCVMDGIHPDTGQPYRIVRRLPPLSNLPVHDAAEIEALLAELKAILPEAQDVGGDVGGGDRSKVNQNALKGDPVLVAQAMALIPNDYHPGDYHSWVKVAAALRGACQDDYSLGLELFEDYTDRGSVTDPTENTARVYGSFKAPFGVGASWIYEQAEKAAPGQFSRAAMYYDHDVSLGASASSVADTPLEPLAWINPVTWEGQPEKPAEWLMPGFIPHKQVSLLYGDGGIGKTLLAQQIATAMAAGKDCLGQRVTPGRVMCFFCEDSADELHRRQNAINRALGVTHSDLGNLRITSRVDGGNILAAFERDGTMRLHPIYHQLLAAAQDFGADLIITDTIADTYGGNEIDRAQVNAFVKGCLGGLARGIKGAVLALGHPSQAGKTEGTSGSGAWNNAARSRLYLTAVDGDIRELENKKLNYGRKGSKLRIEWRSGAFHIIAGTTTAPAKAGVAAIPKLDDAAEDAVVRAVAASHGVRMTDATTTKYAAHKVLKELQPEILKGLTLADTEAAFRRLLRSGVVQSVAVGRDRSSRMTTGFSVKVDKLSDTDAGIPDIFG